MLSVLRITPPAGTIPPKTDAETVHRAIAPLSVCFRHQLNTPNTAVSRTMIRRRSNSTISPQYPSVFFL